MTPNPEAAIGYLLNRAEWEFQRVWRKQRMRWKNTEAMEDEEGNTRDLPDLCPDPTADVGREIVRPVEQRITGAALERVLGSKPKTAQLQAYLVQLCLLHAEVMAQLGVPASVFQRLNAIEEAGNRRTVRKGTRNKSEAIQATTIGLFLNRNRNTALMQVEKFKEFLQGSVREECVKKNADFLVVCRRILASAVARIDLEAGSPAIGSVSGRK